MNLQLQTLRRATVAAMLGFASFGAAAASLPPEVDAALARAKVPREALSVVVQEVGSRSPRLAMNGSRPVNPASLSKLLTTWAALDLLGPAWTWSTPVWLDGAVRDGVLYGNLVIKGNGDPRLVIERVWLLLRRVQQLGVREIRGDIVLDRSAFAPGSRQAGDFDGEPLKPYNVQADALLLNHKAIVFSFTPDPTRGIAVIGSEPSLDGVRADVSVPLSDAPCGDWRAVLQPDFADATRLRFAGRFPTACGAREWAVAYADPASFNARLMTALWREMGGAFAGAVREGAAPTVAPSFEIASPPLADVIRDINKFSNNVMAQQLFLTLGLTQRGSGSPEAAREVMHRWLNERFGDAAGGAFVDNGSGLSRETRVSATLLARLLLAAHASGSMSELMSSLPVSGLDGTLRRSKAPIGRAHLKTGSLRDVAGIAGYVLADNGRRHVIVAIVNHPNANAARPALDAVVQWAVMEPPARGTEPPPEGVPGRLGAARRPARLAGDERVAARSEP